MDEDQQSEVIVEGEAADYLRSLVNKNFRITTTDSRMFWGQFKCTDPVNHSQRGTVYNDESLV
jgi:hypothetical protein